MDVVCSMSFISDCSYIAACVADTEYRLSQLLSCFSSRAQQWKHLSDVRVDLAATSTRPSGTGTATGGSRSINAFLYVACLAFDCTGSISSKAMLAGFESGNVTGMHIPHTFFD